MKIYQLFISTIFFIFLSFFLAATASAAISCSGQNCTDDFKDDYSSWSDNDSVLVETFIRGSAINSVKLSNTAKTSPDGRLFKSFTVTAGATYQVSIKAGVYTDGASPDGAVTLTAVSGTNSQVIWCLNTSCTALGNSINGSLSVSIVAQNSTLTVYLDGTQGGCSATACHDPFVDDFTLTKIADPPPSAPTNLSASCPAPGTSATLSWTASTGATAHNLRVNQFTGVTPEWNGNCTSPQPGDFCMDGATSPKAFSSTAGATYSWWVDACNSSGCTTGSGSNFTCVTTPTLAVQCSVSPTSATTGTNVTWTAFPLGGTSPYTYSWSGTDSLQGKTGNPTTFSYPTTGTKSGSVTVRDSTGTTTPLTTCTNSVTITAPFDYSLSNSGNISVIKGSSGSNTITRTLVSGTSQAVTLTASVLPSGATASFTNNPSNPTSSSTLTIQTTSSTPTGTSTITVTGTSANTANKTTTFNLNVIAPDLITQNLIYAGSTIAGNNMTFSGNVRNQGNASTGSSFNARFCIDNTSCLTSTTGRVSDHTIATLAATTSSSTITSSAWTATLGSHTIYFCADTGSTQTGSITESDDTNNCTSITFNVAAAGSACPTTTEGYSCAGSSPGSNCTQQSGYTCSSGSCYFCSPTSAPTVTVNVPDNCIAPGYTGSGVTISWNSIQNPGVNWVDIDTDSTFAEPYYHSNGLTCSGTSCSITAPTDNVGNLFGAFPSGGTLSLNPLPATYNVRTYNPTANFHSLLANFSILACAVATPTPTPSSGCPWIQTTGGDVHSNEGIKTGC